MMSFSQRRDYLNAKTRREVFNIFCRRCLSPSFVGVIKHSKSYMIDEILLDEFRGSSFAFAMRGKAICASL
jgi:hypothetical protein